MAGRLPNREKETLEIAESVGIIPRKMYKEYEVKALTDRHRLMIRMSAAGYKRPEIAERLGVTPQTVTNVLESRLAVAERARLQRMAEGEFEAIQGKIMELAGRGLMYLEERFEDEATEPKIKDHLALDMLDRAGHGATKRLDVNSTNIYTTLEDIHRIKREMDAVVVEATEVEEEENEDG